MDSEGEVLEQRGSGMGGEVMQKGSELEKWGGGALRWGVLGKKWCPEWC